MMLSILAESALRSLLLGAAVWVGLNLFRIRNPHIQMTCWIAVLVASVSMPLLMHWTTVTVTLDPLPVPTPQNPWLADGPLPESLPPTQASEFNSPVAARGETYQAINWWTLAAAFYGLVAGILLLRLAVGIGLTWRLARAARPVNESWAIRANVRVSDVIGAPVTFGSTILLPPRYVDWNVSKRLAVLAHENAHVANRDFYVLLLASLNRAVFWFSPFAWWQLVRLAELAEIISDARALEVLNDRPSYAEILLDFVRNARPVPAGLEMARPCTVRARVERILASPAAPAKIGWPKRIWTLGAVLPVVVISAGSIAYRTPLPISAVDDARDAAAASRKLQQAEFYSIGPTSIFALVREGDELFGQLTGQRKLPLSVKGDGAYFYPAAGGEITFSLADEAPRSELMLHQNGRDVRAARMAAVPRQQARERIEADASRLDSYVGWYEVTPTRALSVTRDGNRINVQETGRSKLAAAAEGADAFSLGHDLLIFLRDDQRQASEVLLYEPTTGARTARRVEIARARLIEEEFARRMAEVPDRFRDQAPMPGSKQAIVQGIADMQRGSPNYDRMSPSLAAKIRRQVSEMQPMLTSLGAVESVFFRGVGPGGYDVYGVKFANGSAEFRILLGADGKAHDVIFRPDGDEAQGGVVACSSEPGLRSQGGSQGGSPGGTVPIKIFLYNGTGQEIRLYGLDAAGQRTAHRTVGDNMSLAVLTSVDSPWVVADASGKCLKIVMAGQRTRYLTVEGPQGISPERLGVRRSTPQAGSEDMLRQYVEALRRGEPDYDRMTSEVAAQTRAQLPFDQAIVTKLGALRALTFRGVTALDNDIYVAHFANGSAEWRIGLLKDGTIGRIALGPQ